MDRSLVYNGSIPQDTDILSANRNAMVGLGMLAQDIFGAATLASGFRCTPTSPASLNVNMAPGRLYSLQNVDNNAYGSIPADTVHQILKQGISADNIALGCAAPATFGFSVNYLIQAAFQEVDTNLIVLPYYNSNNPSQAYSGPNNSGTAQATTRNGTVAMIAKAGTAAATGTQTTPTPDPGYVGLWVVTVANGQTQITSANISMYSAAPFQSGTFSANYTGFSTIVTGGAQWWRAGPIVFLTLVPVTGASNANSFTINNIPTTILPSTTQLVSVSGAAFRDNGTQLGTTNLSAQVASSGLSFVLANSFASWTPSGGKGLLSQITLSWIIA